MILLLGGTSETAPIAAALARDGHRVLVSTATDAPLKLPRHRNVRRRCGRLTAAGMVALVRKWHVLALVDATHPYAAEAQHAARKAARYAGIGYLRWSRAATSGEKLKSVVHVRNHEEAAQVAFSLGRGVLLTTGSRNLFPYAREAARTGLRLVARVLPLAESLLACRKAGFPEANLISARGPFSVEDTREAIRFAGAGTLVTKDSGVEGGMLEKLDAACRENCRVVVVGRPTARLAEAVDSIGGLLYALHSYIRHRLDTKESTVT